MEEARAHLFIDGRVQGVFYRAFTGEVAHTFGLKGWVKNLRDGRVEAVFEGEKRLIQQAIQQCYTGPSGAKVTKIDVQWEPYTGGEYGFSIRYG
jgi:acylphosphatase